MIFKREGDPVGEIGGYLELEHFHGALYYPEGVAVNNARSALLYILRARNIRKIFLPYYLCGDVMALCEREGVPYELYHINEAFLPVFDHIPEQDEAVYVVNYYGMLNEARESEILKRYGRVIFDHVQAFFQRPIPGGDTVYSCRKFFGVPDGGYAVTDARLEQPLEQDRSQDRFRHLLGRFEGPSASAYYEDFKRSEHAFEDAALLEMSPLTRNLMRGIDYEAVRQKREANFQILSAGLGSKNALHPGTPIGPYAYPFYCKDGPSVRQKLAQEKIYVPTLWPNVLEQGSARERDLAANILPLPCDQRYGADDMDRLLTALNRILSTQ